MNAWSAYLLLPHLVLPLVLLSQEQPLHLLVARLLLAGVGLHLPLVLQALGLK